MSSTRTDLRAWALMLPLLVVILGVVSWPLINTVHLSLTDAGMATRSGNFIGFGNFTRNLGSSACRRSFVNTAWFTAVSISAELVLRWTALLLNQEFHGRTFLRALMILPWALPTVVNAILWRLIYNPNTAR
ncbi:MAG: sugar ABC transporter permease [Paracoccaceae bacterium]